MAKRLADELLSAFKGEGTAAPLVLWSLAEEIRAGGGFGAVTAASE